MLMGKGKNFSGVHVQVHICVCKGEREKKRGRESAQRRAQVTAAYAKHSENIHSAFGEQGTRYALGIQFRLWLKAMSWLCVWLSMSGSVCCQHLSFFFLMLHWNSVVVGLGGSPAPLNICVPTLSLVARPSLLRLGLLLQAWPVLQIAPRLFVAPVLNHSWCFVHESNTFADWWYSP